MEVFMETERLVLRRFTEADVDNLVELDSDPDVMRFLTGGRPTPRDVIKDEVLPGFMDYGRFAGFGVWAAIERASGQFVGWFALRPPEGGTPDDVELGYRLRKSVWGKGYGTDVEYALCRSDWESRQAAAR